MSEIMFRKANENDLERLMQSRYETIKDVCAFDDSFKFSPEFEQQTRDFFNRGSQSTVIATVRVNGVEYLIANATICYINVLPTYSHPTGKRAHLMNVFVKQEYRRKGIAKQLIQMLLDEAKMYGVTEVTLDATETGRYLYQKLGFEDNHEGMVLNIN